jgi:hypothetical protein
MNFAYTYEGLRDTACKGDAQAATFLVQICDVLHLWDDLIDQDKALTPEGINTSMWNALVAIPSNPFYQQNILALQTILRLAITNWHVATAYERSPEAPTDLHAAFILRSTYIDLVTVVAGLCGGPQHAVEVSRYLHRICHDEGFDAFVVALDTERKAREKRNEL